MITPSTIYWLTRLDSICVIGTLLAMFGIISSIVAWIAVCASGCFGDTAEEKALLLKIAKRITAIATVGILIACLVPNTKEAAAMLVIPKVANSESVQQLGDGIVDLAKQWLVELAPKKGETKCLERNR